MSLNKNETEIISGLASFIILSLVYSYNKDDKTITPAQLEKTMINKGAGQTLFYRRCSQMLKSGLLSMEKGRSRGGNLYITEKGIDNLQEMEAYLAYLLGLTFRAK